MKFYKILVVEYSAFFQIFCRALIEWLVTHVYALISNSGIKTSLLEGY
jgi:hypothetical protein